MTIPEERKKKILWISENFPPSTGGVQSYLYNTVTNLNGYGAVVICNGRHDAFSRKIDEELGTRGHEVIRGHFIPPNNGIAALFKLDHMIRTLWLILIQILNKDISFIVIGHSTIFNLTVMNLVSLFTKIPSICLLHGEDVPDPEKNHKSYSMIRWLLQRATIHICNSKFTYDRLIQFCGPSNRFFIAYPGVEERFFNTIDTRLLRDRYRVDNRKVILTVGRLDPRKGHDLVIDALPGLTKIFPDVLYLIGGEGPHLNALREKVARLQLQEYVIFCGFVPDEQIVAFHGLADVFVMPNRIMDDGDTEGFGIVFLEASAAGKPVIGGACGGSLDAIEDGKSGFLVDPYRTDELSAKIVYLLSNPEEAAKMGNAGRQRALDSFRWPHLGARLEKFLSESDIGV